MEDCRSTIDMYIIEYFKLRGDSYCHAKQRPSASSFCAWNDRTDTRNAAQLAVSFVSGWWEVENFPEHIEHAYKGTFYMFRSRDFWGYWKGQKMSVK